MQEQGSVLPQEVTQMGFNRVVDNVVRRQQFEAQYPLVTISHHQEPSWHWSAVWYDAGQRKEVTSPELSDLLDRLDITFG
jgi:hypothetical protein